MKKCPYCAEEIQDEAIKCRHCGEFLDRPSETEGEPAKEEVQTDPWQEFSEKYQAAVDPQKRRFWKGLDQGQKEYVASRFGITEPPPLEVTSPPPEGGGFDLRLKSPKDLASDAGDSLDRLSHSARRPLP